MFLRMLRIDLQRALYSWRFLLCTVAYAVAKILFRSDTVTSAIELLQIPTELQDVLPILAGISFAAVFAEDRNHGILPYELVRSGTPAYSFSKYTAILVSASLTTILGQLLMLAIARKSMPIIDANSYGLYANEETLLRSYMGRLYLEGHYASYILAQLLPETLLITLYIGITACLSVWLENVFFIWALPSVVHYTMIYGFMFLHVNDAYNPDHIIARWMFGIESKDNQLLLGITCITLLLSVVYYLSIRRVTRHD